MRVEGVSLPMRAMLVALTHGSGGFRPAASAPQPENRPPAPAPSLQAATSVQLLVALATAEEPKARREREARPLSHGLGLLERLDRAAATHEPVADLLDQLAAWTGQIDASALPALADLARDIDLRVRVELAKHERFA